MHLLDRIVCGVLRLLLLGYAPDDPRRRERLAELHVMPCGDKLQYVFEILEAIVREGVVPRLRRRSRRRLIRFRCRAATRSGTRCRMKGHLTVDVIFIALRSRRVGVPVVLPLCHLHAPAARYVRRTMRAIPSLSVVARHAHWPVDPSTRGFTTKHGRYVHSTDQCPKYRYGIVSAQRHGRRIHPLDWTTTGTARATGKGICSNCWTP